MCFPVGDPDIQTSCSLRGRLEYTLLGLDGYWSMVSNGKLFKWLMHHILNLHFSENISTVYPCIHWPVVRKWAHKLLCKIVIQWKTSIRYKHICWWIFVARLWILFWVNNLWYISCKRIDAVSKPENGFKNENGMYINWLIRMLNKGHK